MQWNMRSTNTTGLGPKLPSRSKASDHKSMMELLRFELSASANVTWWKGLKAGCQERTPGTDCT